MQSIIKDYKNGNMILHSAIHYALGRDTCIVTIAVDTLIAEWPNIPRRVKKVYQTAIMKAIGAKRAGGRIEVEQWQKILDLEL